MKSSEINAIYSAKVAGFLADGYQINTSSMNGSQGEIAKIDLRKGDEVIRVMLQQKTIWNDESFRTRDAVVLTVGRCTDERVINAQGFERDAIIWNERLEVIEERQFFRMDRYHSDWYLEGKEADKAVEKHVNRMNIRQEMQRIDERWTRMQEIKSEEIKRILLPAVRRHLGKPKMKVDRIAKVTRIWKETRFEYTVTTVGKNRVVLH